MSKLLDWARLRFAESEDPQLVRAKYDASRRQIPMMYFILLSSTWALAATHFATAPAWLTLLVPFVLSVAGCLRLIQWHRAGPGISIEQAETALRRTTLLSGVIAVAFTGWAVALYPYGDAYLQSHVAFYMATTAIACIFSLMHRRAAAALVMAVVIGSFVLVFGTSGRPTFVAISINVVMVTIGMLSVLQINYRTFAAMVSGQQEAEALSAENLRLANIDSLTGLPNRRAYFSKLQLEQKLAREQGRRIALGIVDLDGFKPVNDLYGHSTGDRLLVLAGRRLSEILAGHDAFLARLGGDELAFIVLEDIDGAALTAIGDQLCEALRQPFVLQDTTVLISGSVGCAIDDAIVASDELFDRADYALYQGKRNKRGACTLFNADHHAQIHQEARIEQALRAACIEKEFSVEFQPILDIVSMRLSGFEALARWRSPQLGLVAPGAFIPVAERAGLVDRLTGPLLNKALAAALTWPEELHLAVNLSALDLNSEDGAITLIGIIEDSGIDPRRVDFEITETALSHDYEQVLRSVAQLREMGCGISLDDFGTGYSSLSRLHALPLTQVKIDRSFITNIDVKQTSTKIVRSVLALSRDMGLQCVLEGIETQAELDAVRELGADFVQGYLISRPVTADRISEIIARYQPDAAVIRA